MLRKTVPTSALDRWLDHECTSSSVVSTATLAGAIRDTAKSSERIGRFRSRATLSASASPSSISAANRTAEICSASLSSVGCHDRPSISSRVPSIWLFKVRDKSAYINRDSSRTFGVSRRRRGSAIAVARPVASKLSKDEASHTTSLSWLHQSAYQARPPPPKAHR